MSAVIATAPLRTWVGHLPHLALDRTGIAILAAIAIFASVVTSRDRAARATDAAGRCAVASEWRAHARTSVPVTLLTSALAGSGWR